MIIQSQNHSGTSAEKVTLRCPKCRQIGTFDGVGNDNQAHSGEQLGLRRCPNNDCWTLVFVIRKGHTVLASYPPQRFDFDTTNVHPPVVEILEEAITCHAHECYIASAIMVRRTLEEICEHEDAKGKNLKDRIAALGTKIVIPPNLLKGLDKLRLLGNDAAHIEAKSYANIGKKELDVAIKFTKEVIKAVYQYETLLKELEGLESP